jgi:squalene-associated FAD-dependent desaturase
MEQKSDVIIIGGGLAGLTCAVGLSGSGLKVTLIERSANLGGRAQSWVDAGSGDTVDIGPHVFVSTYKNMFRLLDRLGTRDRIVWHRNKLITLIDHARPVVMRGSPLPAPFHLIPGFVRILNRATISSRDLLSNRRISGLALTIGEDELLKLDDIPADEFLRSQGVTQRFIDWFWATVSMAITNVPLSLCSAGALMRFYQILIGNKNLRFGFPAEGLSELYAPQAKRFIEAHGGRIVFNTEVKTLANVNNTVTGVVLSDGTHLESRFCVCAIPPPRLRDIAPGTWCQRYTLFQQTADFVPNPYVSTYLWFDRKLTTEQFWARLWAPENLNYDFYDLSNIRSGWSDRPSVIASNIMYSHRANHLTDQEIIQATAQEIAEFIPEAARANIRHAVVNRIPMAIPCPFPGTEKKRPPTRTPVRGLFLAGDWLNTGLPACMDGAVRSGWLAAEQIWAEIGKPKQLAVPVRPFAGIAGMIRRIAKM